ncbi:MAG TPA: TolC family protein, partial [Bryobacteraceae bacterium]|nr:TolC family protein [Bryobacteraceae bacterium]
NAITRAFAPFDASVVASVQASQSNTPSYSALEGAQRLSQFREPVRFLFQQTLESGAEYNVGFEASKFSSNNRFAIFNPVLNANITFGFTQPLLRNRGRYVNRLPILIARTQYNVSRFALEHQLNRILEDAQNAYWTVVQARENLRVQERSLESLSAVLKRHKRELELGEIAPVDIYESEQAHAARELSVTEARHRLEQAENELRRSMAIDLHPTFQNVPIVLTEPLSPAQQQVFDREEWVRLALQKRPDLKASDLVLSVDDMLFRQSKNALLPDVSINAAYTSAGRGGQFIQRSQVFGSDDAVGQIVRTIPGGLGDALTQLFGFGFPTYSFALTARLPIRDRRAAADLADATVSKRLNTLRIRAIQQQIRLDVLNAVSRIERSRATLRLAQTSVDIAKSRVEAEQLKYTRGVTTIFFLLDAQTSLTEAEADLVDRSVQYQRDLARLHSAAATSLANFGIVTQ